MSLCCVFLSLQVPAHDYISVLVTSAAKVPAVAWAAVSANWLGKKAAVCTSLLLTAACLLPCITVAVMQPEGVTEGVGGMVTGKQDVLCKYCLLAPVLSNLPAVVLL